jgi:uncharacterized protein (TIGR03067 family)
MATDLDKLQGRWYVTALEADGQQMPAAALGDATIVIDGNRFRSVAMGAVYEGAVDLHAEKKLKTCDLLFTAGPEAGNRNLGIYELTGDRWIMCLATRGTERPRAFATTPGSGFALQTLERAARSLAAETQKPAAAKTSRKTTKPKADMTVVPTGPPTELEGEWMMVAAVFDGAPMDDAMVRWCKRTTRGNLTTVMAGPQTMLKATFRIDSSARPCTIEYQNFAGAAAGKPQLGIFELTGKMLKICMAPPGRPRPGDFGSRPGDGRSFTTWRFASR